MKTLVSEKLDNALKSNVIKTEDLSKVKGYIEASKLYESLISSGLTSKRGNNLISTEKAYSSNIRFNI